MAIPTNQRPQRIIKQCVLENEEFVAYDVVVEIP